MSTPIFRQVLHSRGHFSVTSSARRFQGYRGALGAHLRALPSARLYSDQQQNPIGSDSNKAGSSQGPSKIDFEEYEGLEPEPASRFAPWVTALLIAGMAMSAYGLGSIWGSMTIWPKEIRSDLRYGLREDLKGDRTISAQYLSRAWETTKKMPIEKFGNRDPFLKTSGVAIALAGIYEADGKSERAYQIYQEALNHMQEGGDPANAKLRPGMSSLEQMRAVGIAYKLGELAETLQKPKDEEEKWLMYSVETILRDVMGAPIITEVSLKDHDGREEARGIIEELRLPNWVLKHDLAAPFEALGSFYARAGKVSYAMPLYLQAISILIPPAPAAPSIDDQCRGAQLMGNISELILRTNNDSESVIQAESWANKGLDIASRMRKSTLAKHPSCEVAYAFMLYNLAMIREMAGDQSKARQLFNESLNQSKSIGLVEGVHNAERAIQDLGQGVASVTSLLPKAIP